MTFTFTAKGTYVNGHFVQTGMSSLEERRHVYGMLKAKLFGPNG